MFVEDRVGRLNEPEVVDNFLDIVFSRYSGTDDLTAIVTDCMRSAQTPGGQNHSTQSREVYI